MKYKWTKKYDKVSLGMIAGLIFPIIGFYIAYLVKGGDSFLSFWYMIYKDTSSDSVGIELYRNLKKEVLTYCLLSNMVLFYPTFFIWKMDRFSKGIVGVTILLAGISFIFIL